MTTGLFWDERCLWHDTGTLADALAAQSAIEPTPFIENGEPKRRLRSLLASTKLGPALEPVTGRPATDDELSRFHSSSYLERIRRASAAQGGDAGELAPFGRGSFELAALAAGGCLACVDAVSGEGVRNAYALVRPPGHHAERDRGRGFCLFSNVALAVLHAREAHGVERVAVIDWDVHHGNGTEQAFYTDPNVLTISLHQAGLYPAGGGHVDDRGEGAGHGFNLNIPLPAGSGRGAYLAALDRVAIPALRDHQPELVLLAAGYDAALFDPLSAMLLSSDAFREMTERLLGAVDDLCDGRLVACHEGGYSDWYTPLCGLATVEAMAGIRSGIEDPLCSLAESATGQALESHQSQLLDRAAAMGSRRERADAAVTPRGDSP